MSNILKVLCITEDNIRIQRAAKRDGVNVEQARNETQLRASRLQQKWQRLYGVDNAFDPKYFDLVVDTTIKSPEEILQEVLKKLE